MRINVYSQELTNEIKSITKKSNTDLVYSGIQLMLHSSEMLHHSVDDDDRSAVTFWLPGSQHRREMFARTLEDMARAVRDAAPEMVVVVNQISETNIDDFDDDIPF